MPKTVFVQCATKTTRESVRREVIDGVEHVIVSSATLPDNVVMNDMLYPAEEIEKGYKSLEMTLAPVEHPKDSSGNYISANDARAINAYHVGAYNVNVRREGGRVLIDKYINVPVAKRSDLGKRLLDRVNEIETNDSARPVHTSVGVFVDVVKTDEIKTNDKGKKYSFIATNMRFDHDAILLDSIAAAVPSQGVGMAVNSDGETIDSIIVCADQAFDEKEAAVIEALKKVGIDVNWTERLYDDRVIFRVEEQFFEVPYLIDDAGTATIVGVPLVVERVVTYPVKTNNQEGDAMKEFVINALKAKGVNTDGMSDDQLLAAYNKLQANQDDSNGTGAGDDNGGSTDVIVNSLDAIARRLEGLENKLTANESAEVSRLAGIVVNSGKYPGIDEASAKLLGVDKLKELVANCQTSTAVLPHLVGNNADESAKAPTDMPK